MGRLSRILGRLPFTLLTIAGLAVVAERTRSIRRPLRRRHLRRAGFAPRDLAGPGWHRLVSSAFLTHGREVFGRATATTAACVGAAELRHGTRDAAIAFWSVHLATLLALSAGVGTARATGRLESRLPRDVGPSAGYLGCLGMVCARLPEPLSRATASFVLLGLGTAPFLPALSPSGRDAKLMADVAHLLAFPLGFALGRTLGSDDADAS